MSFCHSLQNLRNWLWIERKISVSNGNLLISIYIVYTWQGYYLVQNFQTSHFHLNINIINRWYNTYVWIREKQSDDYVSNENLAYQLCNDHNIEISNKTTFTNQNRACVNLQSILIIKRTWHRIQLEPNDCGGLKQDLKN